MAKLSEIGKKKKTEEEYAPKTRLEELQDEVTAARSAADNAQTRYADYVSKGYTPGADVSAAKDRYTARSAALESYAPYSNPNAKAMQAALAALVDRPKFNYSTDGDALYERYKNDYQAAGKRAMEDTVGQVSALTGGYANSYAATAGAQAYNDYISKMDEVVPELYQLALSRYNAEGDALAQKYNLLAADDERNYARWANDRSILAELADRAQSDYLNERSFDYGAWGDRGSAYNNLWNMARAWYGDAVNAENTQYGREYTAGRDAVSDAQTRESQALQWAKFNYEKEKDAKELEAKAAGADAVAPMYTKYSELPSEIKDNVEKIGVAVGRTKNWEALYNYLNELEDQGKISEALSRDIVARLEEKYRPLY